MSQLKETLSQYWLTIQRSLFPWLKEELGELTAKQQLTLNGAGSHTYRRANTK